MTLDDLKAYCSTDPMRPNLHAPWSRDGFTYASNVHVIIRVPRIADTLEIPGAPNPDKIFSALEKQVSFAPLPQIEIPHSEDPCLYCDGRGTEHDCPSCNCECERCVGTGRHLPQASVDLNGAVYDARYLKMLALLPDLRFSTSPPKADAGRFIFSGGEGGLMPISGEYATHIKLPSVAGEIP
jgi:hypothetical protein